MFQFCRSASHYWYQHFATLHCLSVKIVLIVQRPSQKTNQNKEKKLTSPRCPDPSRSAASKSRSGSSAHDRPIFQPSSAVRLSVLSHSLKQVREEVQALKSGPFHLKSRIKSNGIAKNRIPPTSSKLCDSETVYEDCLKKLRLLTPLLGLC